ncbi:MAG: hypothetical protein ACRDTH_28505 [Pseudonocardiaceae bacterium]
MIAFSDDDRKTLVSRKTTLRPISDNRVVDIHSTRKIGALRLAGSHLPSVDHRQEPVQHGHSRQQLIVRHGH